MLIYHYDENDGGYTVTTEAQLDPLETIVQQQDIYLLPANATFVSIPTYGEYEIPVWDGSSWSIASDYRGSAVWDSLGNPVNTESIGPLPSGYTTIEPTITPTMKRVNIELAIRLHAESLRNGELYINNIPFYIGVEGMVKLSDAVSWTIYNPDSNNITGDATALVVGGANNSTVTGVPDATLSVGDRIITPTDTLTINTISLVEDIWYYTFNESIAEGTYTISCIYGEPFVNWTVTTPELGFYTVTLTKSNILNIKKTILNFTQECFNVQNTKKKEMLDCPDEDLDDYVVESGWPDTIITI